LPGMAAMVLYGPTRGVDDGADRTAHVIAVDDLDVDDLRLGRDAERRTRRCAGDRRSVRVANARVAGKCIEANSDASRQLGMLVTDAAVEDVDGYAATSAGTPHGAVESRLALGDAIERPRARAQRHSVGEVGQRNPGQDERLRGVEIPPRGAARERAGRRGDDNSRRKAPSDMRQDALPCRGVELPRRRAGRGPFHCISARPAFSKVAAGGTSAWLLCRGPVRDPST